MSFVAEPLADAVSRMNAKMPIAKALTSAEWADVLLALRERSFWTARFAKADLLQLMHDMLQDRIELETHTSDRGETMVSRDNFIGEMRDKLSASGYLPPAGKEGGLQDHTSTGRLGMIFDINTQQAQEFARFKAGSDEGALDAFPCQELYRAESRQIPRAWHTRWGNAGGAFYQGRMVAPKDSSVWYEISAFGTPFPPFDYQSGMDIRDISRSEAEALGVIAPGQPVKRPDVGFNDSLKKSVTGMDPKILADTVKNFGGLVRQQDGILEWVAGRHSLAIAVAPDPALTPALSKMIKSATADVAAVHEYDDTASGPGIPLTPVTDTMSPEGMAKGYSAEYYRRAPGTNMPSINVSPTRGEPLYVVHEIGHEVDHRLFGQGDPYGSHINRELDPLMKAIKDSPEIRAIKAMTWQGNTPAVIQSREFRDYLLAREERFARAYSQWIAERTGRTEYLVSIDRGISNGWSSQWKKETFAPIAAEFEKLFKAKGWLR